MMTTGYNRIRTMRLRTRKRMARRMMRIVCLTAITLKL